MAAELGRLLWLWRLFGWPFGFLALDVQSGQCSRTWTAIEKAGAPLPPAAAAGEEGPPPARGQKARQRRRNETRDQQNPKFKVTHRYSGCRGCCYTPKTSATPRNSHRRSRTTTATCGPSSSCTPPATIQIQIANSKFEMQNSKPQLKIKTQIEAEKGKTILVNGLEIGNWRRTRARFPIIQTAGQYPGLAGSPGSCNLTSIMPPVMQN